MTSLETIASQVIRCRRCPRLVSWREETAAQKRASYRDEDYWGKPVPGFGDPEARVLIVGLAPAAHGANRTGRMFTGDRSGDWLYGALHRAGLASQPESVSLADGLELRGAYVTAGVRCAPPGNRPTTLERDSCRPYLLDEVRWFLPRLAAIVALGGFAFGLTLSVLKEAGVEIPRPKPRFAHGAEVELGGVTVLASYHPSQQNTFTGRLTEPMFDAIWSRAVALADPSGSS